MNGKLEHTFFGIVSASDDTTLLMIYKVWIQYSHISGPCVENDNWTRSLEEFDWFPDVDLGELEVPEPPLFHPQAAEGYPYRFKRRYLYVMKCSIVSKD